MTASRWRTRQTTAVGRRGSALCQWRVNPSSPYLHQVPNSCKCLSSSASYRCFWLITGCREAEPWHVAAARELLCAFAYISICSELKPSFTPTLSAPFAWSELRTTTLELCTAHPTLHSSPYEALTRPPHPRWPFSHLRCRPRVPQTKEVAGFRSSSPPRRIPFRPLHHPTNFRSFPSRGPFPVRPGLRKRSNPPSPGRCLHVRSSQGLLHR